MCMSENVYSSARMKSFDGAFGYIILFDIGIRFRALFLFELSYISASTIFEVYGIYLVPLL